MCVQDGVGGAALATARISREAQSWKLEDKESCSGSSQVSGADPRLLWWIVLSACLPWQQEGAPLQPELAHDCMYSRYALHVIQAHLIAGQLLQHHSRLGAVLGVAASLVGRCTVVKWLILQLVDMLLVEQSPA